MGAVPLPWRLTAGRDVRYRRNSGKLLLTLSSSQFEQSGHRQSPNVYRRRPNGLNPVPYNSPFGGMMKDMRTNEAAEEFAVVHPGEMPWL